MRSFFIWLPILLLSILCLFLWDQNRQMAKELVVFRSDNPQSEALQTKDPSEKSDAHPERPNRELLQLRNEVSLLRNKVDSLMQEQTAMHESIGASLPRDDTSLEKRKLLTEIHQAGISTLESALAKHQEELAKAKQNYLSLWKTLNIPDEILNMEPAAVLKDPRLSQYWPYFETQRDFENQRRIIDAISLKLEAEKLE